MNYTTICSVADDLIGTDSVKFPIARKTRFANRAYERVVGLILNSDGRILFDELNYSTAPIGTATLTSGTRTYSVKVDANSNPIVKLVKVMVENSEGVYQDVKQVDIRSQEGEEIRLGTGGSGTPTRYVRLGANIIYDKTPNYTSATGQKYIFQRMFDEFTTGDTTQEPGFAHQYHMLVPLWMAYWEGLKRGKVQVSGIRNEIVVLEQDLQEHYQNLDIADEMVATTAVDDPR